MNIFTKSSLLLTATLVTGLISFQSHASAFGDSGKYAMTNFNVEKTQGIWILNTETGSTQICWPVYVDKRHESQCGPWTKAK